MYNMLRHAATIGCKQCPLEKHDFVNIPFELVAASTIICRAHTALFGSKDYSMLHMLHDAATSDFSAPINLR